MKLFPGDIAVVVHEGFCLWALPGEGAVNFTRSGDTFLVVATMDYAENYVFVVNNEGELLYINRECLTRLQPTRSRGITKEVIDE